MHIALFEPDIPQNTGTILRLGACVGVPVEIIEPCGFTFSDRALRRAGLDYIEYADVRRHVNFDAFEDWRRAEGRRLVLMTTRASEPYTSFDFMASDVLLLGRESAGVPDQVHARADARLVIPMREGLRSLNVALAAAMALGEALRQTGTAGNQEKVTRIMAECV